MKSLLSENTYEIQLQLIHIKISGDPSLSSEYIISCFYEIKWFIITATKSLSMDSILSHFNKIQFKRSDPLVCGLGMLSEIPDHKTLSCYQPSLCIKTQTCHPGDASQHSCCSHHGIQPWGDTVISSGTFPTEQPDVWVIVCELFHTDAHNPTHYSTQTETRDEQTAWRLEAKCEDRCHQLEYKGQNQEPHSCVNPWACCCFFNGRIYICEVTVVITAIK